MSIDHKHLPNLLVIGAQKGGSTWLYHALKQHPDVFMSEVKELSFFIKEDPTPSNIAEYLQHFSAVDGQTYWGEATPGYFCIPSHKRNVPKNIFDLLGPDVRLILSLRDPIDRAVSAFFHHFRAGRLDAAKSLREQSGFGGIVDFGHYRLCMEAWETAFPREKFYVTAFDDIRMGGQAVASNLFRWLDLPDYPVAGSDEPRNSGFEKEVREGRLCIAERSDNAFNKRFWNGALKADPAAGNPCVTEEDIAYLGEVFADDIAYAQHHIFGRDLGWGPKPLTAYL